MQTQLALFDHGGRVEGVEPTLVARFAGNTDYPPFTLKVRPDLLIRHDHDGAEQGATLEIVEVKTGSRTSVDWLQTVALRRAVGQVYGGAFSCILSTTSFVSMRASRTDNLSPTQAEVADSWRQLKRLAGAILTDTAWQPRPSEHCCSCRYYEAGCPLDSGGVDNAAD